MNITLYSTGCPKCIILEKKLAQKNIDYITNNDVDLMQDKGFMSLPVLEVNGQAMDFGEAIKWINSMEGA